jgi:hypothetical protein
VLLAFTKIDLQQARRPDAPTIPPSNALLGYSHAAPSTVRGGGSSHPLRRELVATVVANAS